MKHRNESLYSYIFKKSLAAVVDTKQRRAEEQWNHLEPSDEEVEDYLMKGVDPHAGWCVEFDAIDRLFFEFDDSINDPENYCPFPVAPEDGH